MGFQLSSTAVTISSAGRCGGRVDAPSPPGAPESTGVLWRHSPLSPHLHPQDGEGSGAWPSHRILSSSSPLYPHVVGELTLRNLRKEHEGVAPGTWDVGEGSANPSA